MSLQARVIILLVGALAFVLQGLGCYWVGHNHGDEAGAERIQALWDDAEKQAEADNKRIRGEGFEIAAEYESKLNILEKRYANSLAQQRAAQRLPFTCPASGEIGDVVVPAELIRSMFNRTADGARLPGSAASEPAH
jgi:hypothetical protein